MQNHLQIFAEYHQGAVCILLHDLGFALWGLGVGLHNLPLIIISPLIFESGHLYNYLTNKRTPYDRQMLPIQILTWLGFIVVGVTLDKLLVRG